MPKQQLKAAKELLLKLPGVKGVGNGFYEEGLWWFKFILAIEHPLAWNVVQELGHILNYISIDERLPTVFYPVSPPPYMNGGPEQYLYWIIENKEKSFSPIDLIEWLKGRLPNPVHDENEWSHNDEEE